MVWTAFHRWLLSYNFTSNGVPLVTDAEVDQSLSSRALIFQIFRLKLSEINGINRP